MVVTANLFLQETFYWSRRNGPMNVFSAVNMVTVVADGALKILTVPEGRAPSKSVLLLKRIVLSLGLEE